MALLRGFGHYQPTLVEPTMGAGMVGQPVLIALGAGGQLGRRQGIMGASHVLLGDGFLSFG